jgi:site-specific DNA-methyltransferase (adenine-specific)
MNHLYYGDNLSVLRDEIRDESVDLIYLDPPFNSNASYNVLFRAPDGAQSAAQIEAFDDTWHWNDSAEAAFSDVLRSGNAAAAEMLRAMRTFLGENDMMAYLAMMAVRLLELHRVLRPTGSLYLHCDPTASHYLKILLDGVFGGANFQNEIIWRRYKRPKGSQHVARKYGRSTDVILFFTKTDQHQFHADRIRTEIDSAEFERRYSLRDGKGPFMNGPLLRSDSMGPRPNLVFEFKGYTPGPAGWRMSRAKLEELDAQGDVFFTSTGLPRRKVRPTETPSSSVDNLWTDIEALTAYSQERLGYPTQKPVALLERILAASSNEGDVVLDPFCGCGTTVHAAEKLKRQWIGIDVTHLAIGLIEKRLRDAFPGVAFTTHGVPQDLAAARDLAARGRYHEFEKWALSLIGAQPGNLGKKGADRGLDGRLYFGRTGMGVVSVKAGDNVGVGMIRDLKGVIEREKAAIGVFLTLTPPTKPMVAEAAAAGQFTDPHFGAPVPRLQIVTVDEAMRLRDRAVAVPVPRQESFRRAAREEDGGRQAALDL